MPVDVDVLLGTLAGGLIAAVAAFSGSVWLEFWRERRSKEREEREQRARELAWRREQIAAAKLVALELNTQIAPLERLVAGHAWKGDCRKRDAWDRSAPTLAGALTISGLLLVERAYAALAIVGEEAEQSKMNVMLRSQSSRVHRLLADVRAGREQVLLVAATFDTLEDLTTGRTPREL